MNIDFYYTMVFAFVISIIMGPVVIRIIKKYKMGQQVRDDGPKSHLKKTGTPTMGGVIFLFSFLITFLFFIPKTLEVFLILLVMLGNGAIGMLDDLTKFARRRSLGLKARNKLLGQGIMVIVLFLILWATGHSTIVEIPFGGPSFNLGIFYPFLMLFIVIGASNAVNLTDGLDGLAAGTANISLLAYLFIALSLGMADIAFFCAAMVGACFGFLIFNFHPAKIFMGDVGSLSLGAALGTIAILTKTEILFVIIGGIFVIETLSVIIQVISYQAIGRRVFKMSPLHHHFELSGWSEWKVVAVFWGAAFILSFFALFSMGA
ncbi:phospho-N-acetylmuramoyl-pentapeptide-transferase [Candidatus Contubernalis alkaliaceticus]|uniref:phospho-N-acetylmuramoyl-pentapeptide- transferase n=1 Tax=Candidatus Contubernalis alkaliaceticus TaxID=338645 RepID=UPI001F4C4251|nr:phospho-N-acetylmuramoyl-pentapeptide-transferase [Candidatus Contubernalis alkalaceticus]UNC92877.1 phospho-N-acetylmuramoyl-pentapeptide-transferase [Candidatus Contubernalis alkalaceticus]